MQESVKCACCRYNSSTGGMGVGAAESLARRNDRAALSWVPNGASVASAGASAGAVVKAMSFAWVVVAARSEMINVKSA